MEEPRTNGTTSQGVCFGTAKFTMPAVTTTGIERLDEQHDPSEGCTASRYPFLSGSQADSTNRSLAAFGKLQHIRSIA